MMKAALVLFILIAAATTTWASPVIGDSLLTQCKGSSSETTTKMSVKDVTATHVKILVEYTSTTEPKPSEEWNAPLAYMTQMEKLVKNLKKVCGTEKMPGTLMTVTTPAGVFTACQVITGEGSERETTYIARVPFWVVKKETAVSQCEALSFVKN